MKAVILAGGKATRLRPYTTNFPKPLMPIGERPILEMVIERLKHFGITDIIISTGYLAEMIRVFFRDGSKLGVKITYSDEEQPLGTAGPLNLIKNQLDDTFILMNGDVLTDLDFETFISFHRKNKGDATIVLSNRKLMIDFGVIDIDDQNCFVSWKEKPTFDYLISTGIYAFEPKTLDVLPTAGSLDVPDFIKRLQKEHYKVLGYTHTGYWLDIGKPMDYEKACLDFADNKIKC
jgi:NDP-mannose synthase